MSTEIHWQQMESPHGDIFIAATSSGVCYIGLPGLGIDAVEEYCRSVFPSINFNRTDTWTSDAISQLREYFLGDRREFTLLLDHHNSSFRKQVLAEVCRIQYGCTTSYGAIANCLNIPGGSRAVGTANATNPLPIVIPCHRVVRSNGGLGGYGGGLDMKRKLLAFELSNSSPLEPPG